LLRRNLPLIYIIEDNGVYGLTKGQFSATADRGSKLKSGIVNELPAVDACALAIELGATFVARTFSGDKQQLSAILKAAISHRGCAMIDVISPCVTFNDHDGSTKSFSYVKDHEESLSDVSFVPFFEDISVQYDPGTTKTVTMHDGSQLLLSKLPAEYDPSNAMDAVHRLAEARKKEEVITGVFYVDPKGADFISLLNLVDEPLATLPQDRVRPEREVLEEIMEELR
jgi:2-oxoglutarate ferredoxin oxidoreductase subunit beta